MPLLHRRALGRQHASIRGGNAPCKSLDWFRPRDAEWPGGALLQLCIARSGRPQGPLMRALPIHFLSGAAIRCLDVMGVTGSNYPDAVRRTGRPLARGWEASTFSL